jgi:threonine synthase
MASGSLFTKVWKGYNEFEKVGLIDGVNTTMHGAQAVGCSPIVKAFDIGETFARPEVPDTIAKSLGIGNPADAYYVLKILEETGGSALGVPEEEIAEGMILLARTEGIFAETAGGVVISALKRLASEGKLGADETVVAYITGNGLKTQEAVAHTVAPVQIEANIESFEANVLGALAS